MTTVASFNDSTVVEGGDQTLNMRMSKSALTNLQTYTLFNMSTEHIKNKVGTEILREGVHKIFEKCLRENNKDNIVLPGGIASTGNVTHHDQVYKHKKPQGSPTHPDRKKLHRQQGR